MSQDQQKPVVDAADGWQDVSSGDSQDAPATEQKGFFRQMGDWMDKSVLSPIQSNLNEEDQIGQAIIDKEINHGNPYRAALAQFYYGSMKDIGKLGMAMTTPKQIALTVATAGENKVAQGVGLAANAYFGWRGSQMLTQGRQDGETDADVMQRRLFGAAQVAGAAAGVGATGKDMIHEAVQNGLGIKGDLAAKVQAKVNESTAVEMAAKSATETRQAAAKVQTDATGEIAQGIDQSIGQELPVRMGQIVATGTQVAQLEKSRVEGLFTALEDKATKPVTDAGDMRAEIVNTLKAHGVQDAEIPSRVFNALPNNNTTARALTASELKASEFVSRLSDQGLGQDDMRASLVNLGYVPKQIDAIMNVAAPTNETGVSFKATTRVKNDLWEAAQAAKDPTIRRGLFEAHDNVIGMQERYAEENGFGPQYKNAKQQYFQFKHELGGGLMNDFLNASEVQDQAMLPRISQIISPANGEALRGLFRGTGIDTTPIADLVAERKSVAEGAAARTSEINSETKVAISAIASQTANTVDAIGKKNAIIPGESDLALAGKGTEQIRRDAVERLVQNARKGGMSNPLAYVQITIGVARILAQSMFGLAQTASGAARIGMQKALQSKSFQDWIIQESGVETPSIPGVRKAIAGAYPALRKLAETGVVPSAINTAQKTQQPTSNPSPVAPSPSSGQIAIAQ